MEQIQATLDQPGFISMEMGSERLRKMIQAQWDKINPNEFSPFAVACLMGSLDGVQQAVSSGTAPAITGAETPLKLGYVALAIRGACSLSPAVPGVVLKHYEVVEYLVQSGAPVDIPDLVGHTALHHACTPPAGNYRIAKLLLEKGANVDAQNRYGEVPLFFPIQGGDSKLVDLLLEHGADLDIPDGNGDSPRKLYVNCGADVTAAVRKWERKRAGKEAPLEDHRQCENCKGKGSGLRMCSRCHTVRYCSVECQRAHWKSHKPNCRSFSNATTVTLKPHYQPHATPLSIASLTRESLGYSKPKKRTEKTLTPQATSATLESNKSMIIKIQVPPTPRSSLPMGMGGFLIYNKSRDFMCNVGRDQDAKAYDTVAEIVRTRGVSGFGGSKAYFVAELKNPDELVVKVSEPLAEQPF